MADIADRAAHEQAFANENALARHLKQAAKAMPSNGICRSCEEPIEPKRLEILPSADLCSGCAQDAEIESRRRAANGGG